MVGGFLGFGKFMLALDIKRVRRYCRESRGVVNSRTRKELTMPPKVLIVEDQAIERREFHNMFADAGRDYVLVDAENSVEARRMAQEEAPNLIILDGMFPEDEKSRVRSDAGIRLLRDLRNEQATARIPVVFVTGMSWEKLSEEELGRLGVYGWFRKGPRGLELKRFWEAVDRALVSAAVS
ncbi:MAG: response regulator [Nanoarchaeota archaeon]|nr:response regulator [Nanoarchaeota archaeon]